MAIDMMSIDDLFFERCWDILLMREKAKRELAAIERKRAAIDVGIDMASMAAVRLIFEGQARPADVLAWDLENALWEQIGELCGGSLLGGSLLFRLHLGDALDPPLLAWCVDHLVQKFQRQPLVPLQRKNGGLAVARGAWDPCSFRHRYGEV